MNIDEVIANFRSVPARQQLYEYIESRCPVVSEPSADASWHSKTIGGQTTIFYAPTARPEASLAHELLHAKLKLDGYKQYCRAFCSGPKQGFISRVLEILDNELQHHKFYGEFLALGFQPSEMYSDDDAGVGEQLEQAIGNLKNSDPIELYFNSFVTLIAPGGSETEGQRKKWERLMQDKCPNRYWNRLVSIRDAFADFKNGETFDAGPTIVKILTALGGYDLTWIGYDDSFPQSGYFVGKAFEIARTDKINS